MILLLLSVTIYSRSSSVKIVIHSISEIIQHPLSMNYIIGEEFLFNCSASNADLLNFLVNGMAADSDTIRHQGFTQTPVISNGDISMTTLIGIAQIQHNGTNVTCSAVNLLLGNVFSNIAVYQVQGNND